MIATLGVLTAIFSWYTPFVRRIDITQTGFIMDKPNDARAGTTDLHSLMSTLNHLQNQHTQSTSPTLKRLQSLFFLKQYEQILQCEFVFLFLVQIQFHFPVFHQNQSVTVCQSIFHTVRDH